MENKNYESMTVKELREESRNRNMTLEHKGHKFTKVELIERLKEHDRKLVEVDIQMDTQKAIDEAIESAEVEVCADCETSPYELASEQKPETRIEFATTLEEIEKKYSVRKPQFIYDNELKVGAIVAFVHYVEAANHNIYKKLRTAKVIGINRKKELVRVVTLLGTEKELGFEDLLYIKGSERWCTFPKDISIYLRNQRTLKGREKMYERFAERDTETN